MYKTIISCTLKIVIAHLEFSTILRYYTLLTVGPDVIVELLINSIKPYYFTPHLFLLFCSSSPFWLLGHTNLFDVVYCVRLLFLIFLSLDWLWTPDTLLIFIFFRLTRATRYFISFTPSNCAASERTAVIRGTESIVSFPTCFTQQLKQALWPLEAVCLMCHLGDAVPVRPRMSCGLATQL